MSSVSIGKGRWSDSGGMVCNIAGRCKVSSLVFSLGRISLQTDGALGVAAGPISVPWRLGTGLLSLTSIALGSPHS